MEADDNRSLAAAAEPRLASRPLPARRRSARPCVLPTTRASLRPPPSHRSHARDGPQREASARPTTKCSKRDVKATADRGRVRANHAPDPPWQAASSPDPPVAAPEQPLEPPAEPNSLPHRQVRPLHGDWWSRSSGPRRSRVDRLFGLAVERQECRDLLAAERDLHVHRVRDELARQGSRDLLARLRANLTDEVIHGLARLRDRPFG